MRTPMGNKPRKVKQRSIADQHAQEEFRRVVFHRAEGRSQITGATAYPMDAHHCVLQQRLRHTAPELVWDPDGAILLTREEHEAHHRRGTVIRYEQLPDYVIRWAEQHGLVYHLERYHPRREAA